MSLYEQVGLFTKHTFIFLGLSLRQVKQEKLEGALVRKKSTGLMRFWVAWHHINIGQLPCVGVCVFPTVHSHSGDRGYWQGCVSVSVFQLPTMHSHSWDRGYWQACVCLVSGFRLCIPTLEIGATYKRHERNSKYAFAVKSTGWCDSELAWRQANRSLSVFCSDYVRVKPSRLLTFGQTTFGLFFSFIYRYVLVRHSTTPHTEFASQDTHTHTEASERVLKRKNDGQCPGMTDFSRLFYFSCGLLFCRFLIFSLHD